MVLFAAIVLFQIVTLPVEFDASRRALKQITDLGLVTSGEHRGARKVLTAAAMTYVAGALTAVTTARLLPARLLRRPPLARERADRKAPPVPNRDRRCG